VKLVNLIVEKLKTVPVPNDALRLKNEQLLTNKMESNILSTVLKTIPVLLDRLVRVQFRSTTAKSFSSSGNCR
jgi:hypothetical protein